jgi:hypothetical protein
VEIIYKIKKKVELNGVSIPAGTTLYIDSRSKIRKSVKGKWVPLEYEGES